jgi:predicted nucleotidyltransferase
MIIGIWIIVGTRRASPGNINDANSMTREEEIKTMIKQTLAGFSRSLQDHQVILFGSRAGGEARPASDFDIGIQGEKPLASEIFSDIEDALDSLPTLYKIELVDLSRVTPAFLKMATSKTEVLL